MNKSEKIKESLRRTRERRKTQRAKTIEVKIQNLTAGKIERLERAFLEAKWLYNWATHQENLFEIDGSKIKKVQVKVGETFEEREISVLGSQIKMEIVNRLKDNIKGLARLKQKGIKAGSLKPKKHVNSLPLPQYGYTYKIDFQRNKVRVQRLGCFRVLGLKQIPQGAEIASAVLLKKPDGYYLHITCFVPAKREVLVEKPLAIDFGVKDKVTLSCGFKIDFAIPESKRLKRLQRSLARKKKGSRNYNKTVELIRREYQRLSNIKRDIHNRILAIAKKYACVVLQKDRIKNWHTGWFSKAVQYSGIGKLRARLCSSLDTILELDCFERTTKICYNCGAYLEVSLRDRVIHCPECGTSVDRDINACYNMLRLALSHNQSLPLDWREVKPVEREVISRIVGVNPYIRLSLVEAGSPPS